MLFSKGRAFAVIGFSLLLTGCGDGWETVEYSGKVPYTIDRTAGNGVMYVRAKMMPEKQLKLADDLEKQLSGSKASKGYGSPKTHPDSAGVPPDVQKTEPHAGAESLTQISPESGPGRLQAGDFHQGEPTAEQRAIEQMLEDDRGAQAEQAAPQGRIVASADSQTFSAASGSEGFPLDPPPVRSMSAPEELSTNSASSGFIAEKQVVVPKKELYKPLSEGERQLNEIYDDGLYQMQD